MAQKRDSLQYFLEHAGNVPLLTPADEIELSRKVQAYLPLRDLYGPLSKQERRTVRIGERAFNRMLMANLRLIVYMAAKQRVNDRGSSPATELRAASQCRQRRATSTSLLRSSGRAVVGWRVRW